MKNDLATLAFAAVAAAGFLAQLLRSRERSVTWNVAAQTLGLEYRNGVISGVTEDGVHVTVTQTQSRKREQAMTTLRMHGPRITGDLSLSSEGVFSSVGKLFTGDDVRTGDDLFDREVEVRGSSDVAMALLGPRARARVRLFLANGGAVETGELRASTSRQLADSNAMVDWVERALAVARDLSRDPAELTTHLAENLSVEPSTAVRVRLVKELRRRPPDAVGEHALQAALEDPEVEVRIAAAAGLEGAAAEQSLNAVVHDETCAEALRVRALKVLAKKHAGAELSATLRFALQSSSAQLQTAAATWVGEKKDHSLVEALLGALRSDEVTVSVAAADALVQLESFGAEDALLARVASGKDPARVASARALGLLGTLRAVETLLPMTKSLTSNGGLREAARDAVRRIQERHSRGDTGGLSVVAVSGAEGGLSLSGPDAPLRDGTGD